MPANRAGYSLLEVLLALSLMAMSMVLMQQWLVEYWQRNSWWQTLAHVSARQVEVLESLAQWQGSLCGPGLLAGQTTAWRWRVDQGHGCQIYDIRLHEQRQQLQKRRHGGRYLGFVEAVRGLQIDYALAAEDACVPETWLTQVPGEWAHRVVLMEVNMQIGLADVIKPLVLPRGWLLEPQDGEQRLWVPVHTTLSLGCHVHD